MTRRVLATIAGNLRTVATAEVAPEAPPAEDGGTPNNEISLTRVVSANWTRNEVRLKSVG